MGEKLKLFDNSGDQGSSEKVGKGAYVKTAKVVSINDKSTYPNMEEGFYFKSGAPTELYLIVTMKIGDYEKQLHLMGRFKRTEAGLIKSWDSWNNDVQRFMVKLLGEDAYIDKDDLTIPNEVMKNLLNKEFKVVTYQSNRQYPDPKTGEMKYSFSTWSKVFSINETLEDIESDWTSNIQYVKDYAPDLVDSKYKKKEDKAARFDPSEFGSDDKPNENKQDDKPPFDTEDEDII